MRKRVSVKQKVVVCESWHDCKEFTTQKTFRKPTKWLMFETFFPFCGKNVPNQVHFVAASGFYHILDDEMERSF